MSQSAFSNAIGLSLRAYSYRLVGKFLHSITLNEVIKAAEMNKGKVRITTSDGVYNIDIHKV